MPHGGQGGVQRPGPGGSVGSEQQAQALLGGQALDKLSVNRRTPWGRRRRRARGQAREGPGQGPRGHLHGSQRPSHLSSPPWPHRPNKVASYCAGLHSPWDGQCLSRRWVCLGGPGSQGPALWSQRREEHSAHPVLPAGRYCRGRGAPEAIKKMPGAGLVQEPRALCSKGRAGSGRPGTGRLDHAQAHWISWALLATATAFGHAGEQEPGQGLVQTQRRARSTC